MFDLLSSSPQLPFGAWMPCSSIVCTWSITSVHSSHRMQLPPGNATLEWWRAHLHETTRVQSPDKGAVAMARAQAFPMSAHEPLLLWLLRRVLEGLQWEEAGCGWLNNSPVDLLIPTQLGRLAGILTCCESQVAVLFLGIARMGADSSQNPIQGWWCNPQCAVLTCHRNE